jgi:hypothetical protein
MVFPLKKVVDQALSCVYKGLGNQESGGNHKAACKKWWDKEASLFEKQAIHT